MEKKHALCRAQIAYEDGRRPQFEVRTDTRHLNKEVDTAMYGCMTGDVHLPGDSALTADHFAGNLRHHGVRGGRDDCHLWRARRHGALLLHEGESGHL